MNSKNVKIVMEKLNKIGEESLTLLEIIDDKVDTVGRDQYMCAYRINQLAHELKKIIDR
tara:strand:+ start:583 stop:759 length:177 start_codon:yes stop_codon:yes gene_type:complete